MLIFESRKTSHVPLVVENNVLELWGLHFNNTSEENKKSFEIGINSIKEELLSLEKEKLKDVRVYFYKPESYFHPSYIKTLSLLLLELSEFGISVVIESNSYSLINKFGYQIDLGNVSKHSIRVYFENLNNSNGFETIELNYDDRGLLNCVGDEPYPIGYLG